MARRRAAALIVLVLLAGVLRSAGAWSEPSAPTSSRCAATWRQVPSPNPSTQSVLWGVAAAGSRDVWAVGHEIDDVSEYTLTLTEHWDGTAWSIVPSPNGPQGTGILKSVSAVSPNDVWAVGQSFDIQDVSKYTTLTLHWDGASWTVVPSPHPGSASELLGVWASGTDDVWAVGDWSSSQQVKFLIEHWDGSVWTQVPVTDLATPDILRSVSGSSSDDVWAVGVTGVNTVAFHWDGTLWKQVSTPTPGYFNDGLYDVSALASDDVWAVGYSESQDSSTYWSKWHWDGTAWTSDPNDPQLSFIYPAGVGGSTWGDIWSVGNWGVDYSASDHWNGTNWSRATTFSVVPTGGLLDVAAVKRAVWIVGWAAGHGQTWTYIARVCPISVTDSGFGPPSEQLRLGERAFWTVGPNSAQAHSISDGSGMGLFDSGVVPAGASFDFVFDAAGTYPVIDGGHSSSLAVGLTVSPKQGGLTTTFHVLWADYYAQPGFRYDVQIRRPGAPGFVDWKVGQVPDEADFTPDGGTGTYQFRARLRNVDIGGASGWSPPASIVVS